MTTSDSPSVEAGQSDVDPMLVAKVDRAVHAALREGIRGPEVETALDWVTQHRARLRQAKARDGLNAVLAEIRQAEGDT